MRAAVDANRIYANRLRQEQQEARNKGQGSGPGGQGSAYDSHATWGCLTDLDHALSERCSRVVNDLAAAMIDETYCSNPSSRDNPACGMLKDWRFLAEEHPEILADLLQMVLMACGLVPVVGEACDGLDAAVSFARGDWVGGFLSLGSMVPLAGWLTAAAKATKNADRFREAMKFVEMLAGKCPRARSAAAPGRAATTGEYYVPDDTVIVFGGTGDIPTDGSKFSGAMGNSLEDASGSIGYGKVRPTTAGEIRAAGGTVDYNPEPIRAGPINYKHVDVRLAGTNPFGAIRENPVPKAARQTPSTLGFPCD
jgi:hypothetical protein